MQHARISKPASAPAANARSGTLSFWQPHRSLQRKCACGGEAGFFGTCAKCQLGQHSALQRRADGQGDSATVPPIVHDVLGSPGQPLDAETRAFMEPRFGHDFSGVRVHSDARAAQSAGVVHALAYTVGRDVVFGSSQYLPKELEGRRLLAHELTHVLQQSKNSNTSETVGFIDDSHSETESEADIMASDIVNARLPPSQNAFGRTALSTHGTLQVSASPISIQRDEQPWPVNGYVVNESSKPVTVWSDSKGIYKIPANSTSGRFTEDVDHIRDTDGNWYKIGANTVTVDKAGKITGYKCKVSDYGKDCEK